MKIFTLFVSFILLFSSCSDEKGLKRGEVAPDVVFELTDGSKVKLSDFRGKVVMLYFWADWCPACKKEFPETQNYYKELKSEEFELIAVNVGQPKSVSEKFAKDFGAEFLTACDEDKSISKIFGIEEKLPVNYFIDKQGKIIRRINAWTDGNQVNVIIHQNK
jgi:peroxiredoxin